MSNYQTIVADPPWPFRDKLPGKGRGAAKHYQMMTMEDIYQYQLPEVADDARLFLWAVAAMPEEAIHTMTAWGFRPVCELIWVKLTSGGKPWFGMGRTVREANERCIIGVRGRPKMLSRSVRSVFTAKAGPHSEKPGAFYQLVEELSPGPYLELFGRRQRQGWTVLGSELEPGNVSP